MDEVCSDTSKEAKLTFLLSHGPSNSFKYPESQNIHTIEGSQSKIESDKAQGS